MQVAQATQSIHFAMIPQHIGHAAVSERAKGLWREMAYCCGPKNLPYGYGKMILLSV